jgi:hypothetical protein
MPNLLTPVDNFATKLSALVTSSDLSFPCDSLTALGVVTAGVFLIDANTSKAEYVFANNVSSSNLLIFARGQLQTAAVDHAQGASVMLVYSSTYIKGIVDNIKVGHNDDGSHKASLPLTSPILTTPVFRGVDGWNDANETWTYASATTFTITGDLRGKYQVGDKIKAIPKQQLNMAILRLLVFLHQIQQLQLIRGADYTLANAAITLPYYSKAENPQGFPPDGFNYNLNWTGVVTNPTIGNGTLIAKYRLNGKFATIYATIIFGSTTNKGSGSYVFNAPFNAKTTSTEDNQLGWSHVIDTGVARYYCVARLGQSGNLISVDRLSNSIQIGDTSPFTFGNGDSITINMTYLTDL